MRDGPVGPKTMTSQQPSNLSIEQLREMAARQQQQIEAQQSHLVAKVLYCTTTGTVMYCTAVTSSGQGTVLYNTRYCNVLYSSHI